MDRKIRHRQLCWGQKTTSGYRGSLVCGRIFETKSKKRGIDMRQAGFTLMELLVVLVIVGVLVALSVPAFEKTVDEMHKKEARAMLRLIEGAEYIYRIENNFHYPFNRPSQPPFSNDAAGDATRSFLRVNVYDNDDWTYLVDGGAVTLALWATRERGKRKGQMITLPLDPAGPMIEYVW